MDLDLDLRGGFDLDLSNVEELEKGLKADDGDDKAGDTGESGRGTSVLSIAFTILRDAPPLAVPGRLIRRVDMDRARRT